MVGWIYRISRRTYRADQDNLYYTMEWSTELFPHLAIHHGPLYWLVLGLSYVIVGIGFFMLLERFHHTGTNSLPLNVSVAVTALPAAATVLNQQIESLLPLMYEPPAVAIFVIGTLFVYFENFEAIRLTGGTDKPAIFLDQDGSIRDYNQAAQNIFPELQDSVGTPAESINPSFTENPIDSKVIAVTRNGNERFYQVSSSPFMAGEVRTGELLTVTDVTDQESYRRKLEQKSEQLEALNRLIRHDIRNDMSVILGWTESLQNHVDEDGKPALEHILQKSRHVIQITETARNFVESLSDNESAETKPIDIHQILETEIAAVRDSHPQTEIKTPNNLPHMSVQGNETLSSVFRNILENAIRHNHQDNPAITVSYEEHPEKIHIQIADNGPGIPDEQKKQIFGKGEKGLDSPGSGIGLYLVHTLIQQLGGKVWVEDNQPTGAVFNVELRKAETK